MMPKVVTAQVLRFNEELVDELLGQVPVATKLLQPAKDAAGVAVSCQPGARMQQL